MEVKKIFHGVLAVMFLAACNESARTYYIEGYTEAEPDGSEVYLTDYVTDVRYDTAVVRDGVFAFDGVVDTPFLAVVEAGDLVFPLIVEPAETLFVDLFEPAPVSGAPLNDALNAFNERNQLLLDDYRQTVDSIMDLASRRQIDEDVALARLNEHELDVNRRFDDNIRSTIAAHPDDIVGAFALRHWLASRECESAWVDSVMRQMPPALQHFAIVSEELAMIRYKAMSAVGKPFRDFTAVSGGKEVSLGDYVGHGVPVLLLFWASWDEPAPSDVLYLSNRYKGNELAIVGVAVWDKPSDSLAAIEAHQTPWRQLLDTANLSPDLYMLNTVPYTILFARDGTIAARGLKGAPLCDAVARAVATGK